MGVTRIRGRRLRQRKFSDNASTTGPKICILFNKPFGVLSQFTDSEGRPTLANFGPFPPDVYPVGRLDADSEGMLILTNDNRLKQMLLEPKFGHPRTYLVQVERIPSDGVLETLRTGVVLDGKRTRPAGVRILADTPVLRERPVPIRFRKNVPTAWLELTLTEGRNRQVRRMTAAVGHPTLRLVRVMIGKLSLGEMEPGTYRRLDGAEIDALLLKKGL